jgi:DNA-directed RNA polymerase subunit E'/Rpb7
MEKPTTKRVRKTKKVQSEEPVESPTLSQFNYPTSKDDINIKIPYTNSIIKHVCVIPISALLHNSVKKLVKEILIEEYEGKCKEQGYIKPDSIELITVSYGSISGSDITVESTFSCQVFNTHEGDLIYVVSESITKAAGIKAVIYGEKPTPAIVLIPKDFHIENDLFNSAEINKKYLIKVINQQFILNDKMMVVIGILIE